MTDITELAQSLKAAAEKWQEAWGKYDKVEITIAEFIRAAEQYESIVKDPANVLALVEALEKAQGMEAYWKTQCRGITDHCEELQARIAELESRTVKLPPAVAVADWMVDIDVYEADLVRALLTAAGIKVEAE
ncbi:TPA: hypothetical protein L9H86_004732 [Klebsiella quasipneumoniae]|nr:hypothetical protein [Klebsiella quasipneumoniae]